MPLVSAIIPVYNRPAHLIKAVGSILSQTFSDFELIIADDGSTDETPFIAERLASEDGRIRVLKFPHSGMPGAARNRGAEAAEGRFLAFLDSDDYWFPDKLKEQTRLMQEHKLQISHTREQWMRNGKEVSQKGQKHRREGDIFTDALKKCIIGPSTVMIARDFYFDTGGFNENLEIAEDYEYWLRITHATKVAYLNEKHTCKQAGDWPQLSEKYGRIEWFRLTGLAGLLGISEDFAKIYPDFPMRAYTEGYMWPGFTGERKKAAFNELEFKCRVWAEGCRKHGRPDEAEQLEGLIKRVNFKTPEADYAE